MPVFLRCLTLSGWFDYIGILHSRFFLASFNSIGDCYTLQDAICCIWIVRKTLYFTCYTVTWWLHSHGLPLVIDYFFCAMVTSFSHCCAHFCVYAHVALPQGIMYTLPLQFKLRSNHSHFMKVLCLTDLGASAAPPHCRCQGEALIIWRQANVGSL